MTMDRNALLTAIRRVTHECEVAEDARDLLITAVRDALDDRDCEWFPDGLPDHEAAAEAIGWLAQQVRERNYGYLPSRW